MTIEELVEAIDKTKDIEIPFEPEGPAETDPLKVEPRNKYMVLSDMNFHAGLILRYATIIDALVGRLSDKDGAVAAYMELLGERVEELATDWADLKQVLEYTPKEKN